MCYQNCNQHHAQHSLSQNRDRSSVISDFRATASCAKLVRLSKKNERKPTHPLKKSAGSKSAAVMQTSPFSREKNIGVPLCTAADNILSPCIGNSIFSFSSFSPNWSKQIRKCFHCRINNVDTHRSNTLGILFCPHKCTQRFGSS